ncbi:MAG: helix-turn-helix transcriptional regulator [Parasporobacterium sp.]|nr:helix-turn-helix transcriptional regulator [Parasporobacterium sp.]
MPTEIALERAQTLGSRIKAVRKQKGLQQKELALRIGCNGSHLSDIEGDKKNPSLDTLKRISEELDTTVDFFLLDSPHSCKSYLRDDELGSIVERCNTSTLRRIVHVAELFLEEQQEYEKRLAQYE